MVPVAQEPIMPSRLVELLVPVVAAQVAAETTIPQRLHLQKPAARVALVVYMAQVVVLAAAQAASVT